MAAEKDDRPDIENKVVKVEEELLRINPQLFQNIPPKKRDEIVRSFISITKVRSSPFPPVEELQEYEKLHPGCSKMIFDAFAAQSAHRISMEAMVISSQQKQSGLGQMMAFTIAILFLGVAAWITHEGHDVVGGILGGFDIVGLATVFIVGRKQQSQNLSEKNSGNSVPKRKK